MNPVELIARKRDGKKLSPEEIAFLVQGYAEDKIPDYQMSAFIMAYYFQDMVCGNLFYDELASLTDAMVHSGEILDFSADFPLLYDKHSTGGVGDKVSFISTPIVTACGLPSLLLSGRGLGHTGGTLDKMESIPGIRVNLNREEMLRALKESGMVITGTTSAIAPADRKLYALRDVTATVPSVGLISASILSKKLAIRPSSLVLDVKYGSGAFMKDINQAKRLASCMQKILTELNRSCRVLITSMEEPLGRSIGNALEIKESIAILQGEKDGLEDLIQVSLALAAASIEMSGCSPAEAREKAVAALQSGAAYQTFCSFVEAQGGDVRYLEKPDLFPGARHCLPVSAPSSGYVTHIDCESMVLAANILGAGRFQLGDSIDHAAGIVTCAQRGTWIEAGQTLALMHSNRREALAEAEARILSAYRIAPQSIQKEELILR
ncbi:MAG: thymidine phosphorylase [Spirochaetales bacterium]|nr:thymidine phosphorylase [Spirochaetales bacterium]